RPLWQGGEAKQAAGRSSADDVESELDGGELVLDRVARNAERWADLGRGESSGQMLREQHARADATWKLAHEPRERSEETHALPGRGRGRDPAQQRARRAGPSVVGSRGRGCATERCGDRHQLREERAEMNGA